MKISNLVPPYDFVSRLCLRNNDRSVCSNLKRVGEITALMLNLVHNHQTSFTPVQLQPTSDIQYRADPLSGLNCFFNEKKKGTVQCLLRHPSPARALPKYSKTINFKIEAIFWRKSSRNSGFFNMVILSRSKFSLACLYSNKSFMVHPQASSCKRYSTNGSSIWTT